jgi:hypothetical protein
VINDYELQGSEREEDGAEVVFERREGESRRLG